jgi:hypothetical protein
MFADYLCCYSGLQAFVTEIPWVRTSDLELISDERRPNTMNWFSRFWGREGPPPQPPRPGPGRPLPAYGALLNPTYPQLLQAAFCLHRILSDFENIIYCFVGPFVALTQGSDIQVQTLEILLDATLLRDNSRRLNEIFATYSRYLAMTPSQHLIVILGDTNPWGVAVKPWFTESADFPCKLVPPPSPDCTFWRGSVRGDGTGRQLPMLRWHLLLHQRLLHLEENPASPVKRLEMERYIFEIRAFLYFATIEREGPLPPHEVESLKQKIAVWIRMSLERGHIVSPNDHEAWLSILGLQITWLHLGMVGRAGL